eukprot:scaffold13207_cov111-Skeletonema_dohrnii-CCMP3373.AAC.1
MNATGPPFAAAADASQSSSSSHRKRSSKHAAADDTLLEPTKTKLGDPARDKPITKEMFEGMLRTPYGPRKNKGGVIKSGEDRRGHT